MLVGLYILSVSTFNPDLAAVYLSATSDFGSFPYLARSSIREYCKMFLRKVAA